MNWWVFPLCLEGHPYVKGFLCYTSKKVLRGWVICLAFWTSKIRFPGVGFQGIPEMFWKNTGIFSRNLGISMFFLGVGPFLFFSKYGLVFLEVHIPNIFTPRSILEIWKVPSFLLVDIYIPGQIIATSHHRFPPKCSV